MTTSAEIILIGGVIRALRQRDSWTGETHIQKTCYVAKIVEHVPFESEFILYKHGPYSFDLSSSLGHMRAQRIISVTPQTFGSTFDVVEGIWLALERASSNIYESYADQIGSICDVLAKKKVAELERIVTAIYVFVNFPDMSLDQMAHKLAELKPHINSRQAVDAFEEAEVFTKKIRKH